MPLLAAQLQSHAAVPLAKVTGGEGCLACEVALPVRPDACADVLQVGVLSPRQDTQQVKAPVDHGLPTPEVRRHQVDQSPVRHGRGASASSAASIERPAAPISGRSNACKHGGDGKPRHVRGGCSL
jgi:hypothetical protein